MEINSFINIFLIGLTFWAALKTRGIEPESYTNLRNS